MSGLSRSSHALVTGGGRGIGRAIAASLAQAGATVTIMGRNLAVLNEVVAAGDAHHAISADVSDQAALNAAIADAAKRQPVDILVANAGAAESAPFVKSDAALFQRMMEVNFMGVVYATQAVLPEMVKRKNGRIVAVASTAGLKGYGYVSAYSAAKHAVIGLTKTAAAETARKGIRVNAICPAFADTPMLTESLAQPGRSQEEMVSRLVQTMPMRRAGTADEIVQAMLWICSAENSFMTGHALVVDGGLTAL